MPTVTGQTVVTQALTDLGILSPGEGIDASNLNNGFTKLNMLLDSLIGSRDFIYAVKSSLFTLTANLPSALIGPGGSAPFNVARPVNIENAQIQVASGGDFLTHDVEIVSQTEFQSIDDKAASGNLITKLYFEPTVPDARLYFWPMAKCAVTTKLELGLWITLTSFPDLFTNVDIPPTYNRFINLALQLELAPTYGSLVNSAIMQLRVGEYQDAKEKMQSLNASVGRMPTAASNPLAQMAAHLQAGK